MIAELHKLVDSGFFTGAALGLLVALFLWWFGMIQRSRLRRAKLRLETELRGQIDISTRSTITLKRRIRELKLQNRSLEAAVAAWQKKPRRAELCNLLVYEEAVAGLKARIPGFTQAWEQARQEAEEEVARANRGLGRIFLRPRRPPRSESEKNTPRLSAGSES